jgi:hypothetical protein
LCCAQNLSELRAVATRSRSENGRGMDTSTALQEIAPGRTLFHLPPYTLEVVEAWQRLVATHDISGKQTRDARLAAIMRVHSVNIDTDLQRNTF